MENNAKNCSLLVKNFTLQNNPNSQFLKTKFFAIAEGENLNRSSFDINGIKECIEENDYTFKPILGSWKKDKASEVGFGDFGGHDSDLDFDTMSGEMYNTYLGDGLERPLGLILPNTAKIEVYKGKQWLTFEGLIWAEYNREAVRLLKKKRTNNVSVEIKVLESYQDDNGIEIIKRFSLLGITIIGVRPGIENAHLDVENFSATQQFSRFVKVFSSKMDDFEGKTMEFLKKDEYGSGEKLDISLSNEDASNDAWGPINKTKLRNDLLKAKNYKSLIPKAYLVVMEGWEDAPSEKLKYPIVQIKGGKVVLNINGVQAAGSYLMKEKDESYFRTAKAKLNRIRKILGMEKLMSLEFGVETNEDIEGEVSKNQPNIIKMEGGESANMERKEIVSQLSQLFKDKNQFEEEHKTLSSIYEEKLGEYEYAEEDKKEEMQAEVEASKKDMEEKAEQIATCSKSIIELSSSLISMESEEDNNQENLEQNPDKDINDYEENNDSDDKDDNDNDNDDSDDKEPDEDKDSDKEEFTSTDEDRAIYSSKLEEGSNYISNSKNYVVFEREGELFICKYTCGEDGEVKMEEAIKCERVFATFITGGVGSPENVVAIPVNVEITNRVYNLYAEIKEKENKVSETQKQFEEAQEKVQLAENAKEEYKLNVKSMLSKFEELTVSENTTKEFKEEIYSKIFESSFASVEDLETKVKAGLYELNKNKFLSGSYSRTQNMNTTTNKTESQKINDIINKY
ncbi:MAG: hypothetical protein IKI95_08505 [Clostridia bacterium]|nr:hypothetical protein [Clostridia bacterium]